MLIGTAFSEHILSMMGGINEIYLRPSVMNDFSGPQLSNAVSVVHSIPISVLLTNASSPIFITIVRYAEASSHLRRS